MNWSQEDDKTLAVLWAEGHSGDEIGRRMGRGKNSIIGRVHRLGLASRPSPIRSARPAWNARETTDEKLAEARALFVKGTGITVVYRQVELPYSVLHRLRDEINPLKSDAPIVTLPPMPVAEVDAAPNVVAIPKPFRPGPSCQWPIGEPGTKTFRFCDDAAVFRKPYCEKHCAKGYAKVAA